MREKRIASVFSVAIHRRSIHCFGRKRKSRFTDRTYPDYSDFERKSSALRDPKNLTNKNESCKNNPYHTGGLLYTSNCLINTHAQHGRIDEARSVFDSMPRRNTVSWNSMISAYARAEGMMKEARAIFDMMPSRNVVSWNAMIAGYCRNGQTRNARQLFDEMPVRDDVSWTAMISGYCDNGQVDYAREIFDRLEDKTVASCNAIIAGYAKNCRMEEARRVFEKAKERNVVSWNAMVSGYSQNYMIEAARRVFDEMPSRNVVSWCAMIAGYVHCDRVDDAYQLFEKMPFKSTVSWATMVTGFAQNRRILEARQLFDKMPEKNIVSWNAMIAGYVQNHMMEEAYQLFQIMPKHDSVSWSTIITGLVQSGRLEDARKHIDKMPNPNVVAWTAMITGYIQHGKLDDALEIFNKMPRHDIVSWNAMLGGYVQHGDIDKASKFFNSMPSKDAVSWNTMMAGYAQSNMIKDCLQLFHSMPERNLVSWNTLIAAYAQNGHHEDAFRVYYKMQLEGIRPDECTFISALSVCAELAAMGQGKQVHVNIIKSGFGSKNVVGNALITFYSKCGRIDLSRQIFDSMYMHDVISWNAIIVGYAYHGQGKEALGMFQHMQELGEAPDPVTFVGVLNACSHSGLVDEGWLLFNSMHKKYGVEPEPEHYACMIDLLGRAGQFSEAKSLIRNMPCKPNATMWSALLGKCNTYGNIELAKFAAKEVFKLEPERTSNYVMLSNVYARCGRWTDVENVRAMMREKSVKKQPGCSWIEIKNKIHSFLANDTSHPRSDEIYLQLNSLISKIKELGYMPNKDLVKHDVDDEQKVWSITYHSEKLALAFALINLYSAAPICIIKNLRVCMDCHNFIKLTSGIIQREIIVRDSSRFHHFRDGKCSCRDYW